MNRLGVASAVTFVAVVALANVATAHLGMVELPFGAAVTAGTFLAGAALILRDAVHEFAGRLAVAGCIAAGAAAALPGAPARIAMASAVAFAIAEMVDWAVYSPLRSHGYGRAVLVSSIVAAPIDTAIFLGIAGFPVELGSISGQVFVKVSMAVLAAVIVRAVLRYRVRPAGN